MLTHRLLSSVVILGLALGATAARAQSANRRPQRLPTFSQRLGNIRDTFLGERDDEPEDEPFPEESAPPAPRVGSVNHAHSAPKAEAGESPSSKRNHVSRSNGYSSRRTAQPDYHSEGGQESTIAPQHSKTVEEPVDEPESDALESPLEENVVQPAEHHSPSLDEILARVRARKSASTSTDSETIGSDDPSPPPVAKKTERVAQKPVRHPVADTAGEPDEIQTDEHAAQLPSRSDGDSVLVTRKSPELRVETTGPRRITVGKEVSYKVVVHNEADVAAQGITLTIEAPQWTKITGTQASTGEVRKLSGDEAGQCQWRIQKLEGRNRAEFTLRLVADKSQSFDLSVQWTSSPLTAQAVVEVEEPKLAMTISGPKEVAYGEKALYKLTFSNPGTADTEHVVVRLLPIGSGNDAIDTHEIGKLAAGSSRTVEIELVARQSGRLNIKAQATAAGGLESSATQEVLVRRAALEVKVEGPKFQYAGTAATFHVHVKNTGNEAARNLQLAAILPREATYASSDHDGQYDADTSRVTWNLKDLAPDAEESITVKGVLIAGGTNELSATCDADGDLHGSGSCVTEVEALADLVLHVNDPQGPVEVGKDVVYEVLVKNRGTKSAEGVDVVAFFSEGIEPVTVDSGKYEIGPGKVVFGQLLAISAGEEIVFRITARASKPGNHVCRAEVHCTTPDTSLAVEETTKFYDDASVGNSTSSAAEGNAAEPEPAGEEAGPQSGVELQPVPAAKAAPTPAARTSKGR